MMGDAEQRGHVVSWTIERSVAGRVHRLAVCATIPRGLEVRHTSPSGGETVLDEGDTLFLEEALRLAETEISEWLRMAATDPWDPSRMEGDWAITRRIGRARFTLRVDLSERGRPAIVYERSSERKGSFSVEEAVFLRQSLSAIVAEQQVFERLEDVAPVYGIEIRSQPQRSGQPWSEEEKATVARLWQQGVDVTTLAEHLGRSELAVATQLNRMDIAERDAVMFTSRSVPNFDEDEPTVDGLSSTE